MKINRHSAMGIDAIGDLTSKGPASDINRLVALLPEADLHVKINSLLADAGYDSESNHVFARVGCGIRSLMPAKHGRRSNKPLTGYWRRQMRAQLSTKTKRRRCGYTQRAQAETGFSMIKRRQGEAGNATGGGKCNNGDVQQRGRS